MVSSRPTLEHIKKTLKALKPELERTFHITEIGIFGSHVTGRQSPASDVDILADFSARIGLIEFIRLENHLSDALGLKVDLVMKGSLKPRIGKRILAEVVMI